MEQINNNLFNGKLSEDKQHFKVLFEKYYPSLFSYACKFVDSESAKDIVQDSFFIFWKNRDKIKIKTSFNSYLFRIVRNNSLQCINRLKDRNINGIDLSVVVDEINYYESGVNSLIELELENQISKALDMMPEKCRLVFEMSRYRKLKNKEIAEELGISVKAVEKHISKALKVLRLELNEYLPFLFIIFLSIDK